MNLDEWRASLHEVRVCPITAILFTCHRVYDEAQYYSSKLKKDLYSTGSVALYSKLQPLCAFGLQVEHTCTSGLGGISIFYRYVFAPYCTPTIALAKLYAFTYETVQQDPELRVHNLAISLHVDSPTMPVEFAAVLCALRLVPGVKVCTASVTLPETASPMDHSASQALTTELKAAILGKPDNDNNHLTDNVLEDLQAVRDWCTPVTDAPRFFGIEPIFYCCEALEAALADSIEDEIAEETMGMPHKPSFKHARRKQMIANASLNPIASAFVPGAASHAHRLCREKLDGKNEICSNTHIPGWRQ